MEEVIQYLMGQGASVWLVAAFLLLNLFKQPLATFLPQAWKDWYSSRLHKEELEETQLDGELQQRATEMLRQANMDQNMVEMVRNVLQWQQTFCSDLKVVLERNTEALVQIRLTQERTNGLLTGVIATMGKLVEDNAKE